MNSLGLSKLIVFCVNKYAIAEEVEQISNIAQWKIHVKQKKDITEVDCCR